MSRNIGIKDGLYEKLKNEKGLHSFSWIIEQYINRIPVSPIGQDENLQAAQHQAIKQGEAND